MLFTPGFLLRELFDRPLHTSELDPFFCDFLRLVGLGAAGEGVVVDLWVCMSRIWRPSLQATTPWKKENREFPHSNADPCFELVSLLHLGASEGVGADAKAQPHQTDFAAPLQEALSSCLLSSIYS